MREQVARVTFVVAASLALSGCSYTLSAPPAGSSQTQDPGQNQAGQSKSAPNAGSANPSAERPCTASDVDATFNTGEVYNGGVSNGLFSVTKNSSTKAPCVLDGYAELTLMRDNEGGQTLPATFQKETADGAKPMRLVDPGDFASFTVTWTTSGDDGGCDMPGALSVTLPGDTAQPIEVPVNQGAQNSMRVCENHEFKLVPFGDYTD